MKILIIEDDATANFLLSSFLRDCAHQVFEAVDCEEALFLAKAENPELIITDWQLNGRLTGIEVCEELKLILPTHAVFVMTGSPLNDVKEAGGSLAPSRYFVKPVDLPDIEKAVNVLLAQTL